ncbi:hypothetical protein [Bacillus swezeyi]|uniref:hypothetical protein n=1 Tax=Bacillus swezeyi TaxID=1925020 RepID=UPI0027DB9255|nr:hypothetical protein [Bacillus swezeyi]
MCPGPEKLLLKMFHEFYRTEKEGAGKKLLDPSPGLDVSIVTAYLEVEQAQNLVQF